jgi:3-hydroxy-9,10-secoandrosta-1,3,5(10)-triene-9,17-dione monooxygenase
MTNAKAHDSHAQETRERLLKTAEAMIPALQKRSEETNQLGKLPDNTIKEMQKAGFFKILQPKAFGGYELEVKDFFDVQIKLSEGCMSTAWVLGVVAIHNWQLGMFDEKAQQDVWGEDDSTLISSSYMPVGKVEVVDGGFMFSGRWGFSSGSKHCDWAFLGGLIFSEEGAPPDYRTFMVPRSDYQIVDNWDVSGLEGTGSNDILIEEPVFVPEYRTHRSMDGFSGENPGCKTNSNPLYTLPFGQVFVRAVCSSSIGALQGALDAYLKINRDRVGLSDGSKIQLDTNAQMAAATAISVIDECKVVMYRNFELMVQAAESKTPLNINERIKMRYDASLVADKCAKAVNDLFIFSGAQGIFKSHPINRAWRDINAGRTHVANNLYKFGQNLGGTEMGLANEDFFL